LRGFPGRRKNTETEETRPRKYCMGHLFSRVTPKFREYSYETDGPLTEPVLPEGYQETERYWVDEGRALVVIALNIRKRQNEYLLFEPGLSEFEYEILERLYADLRDILILTDEEITADRQTVLSEKTALLISEYGVALSQDAVFRLRYYLFRNFLGWSRLDPLMNDPGIEDISCDGSMIPLYLYHRRYGNIRTNIAFEETALNSLAISLAQRSGKHISISSPILDASLPGGSRLQLTLGTEVTSRGTSFTIRKFSADPFTPVDLLEFNTFDPESLVYLWLAIENNKSLIFVGGTASGKTTSLNAVSQFIPALSKIVSIEDTREITLYHENWIASITREGVSGAVRGANIGMFDLLRAALRQRPEYLIVGEVRGSEAQTLFQAMNTGHTTFSTLHANSVDATIHRLENPPLNVPRNMLQALEIISVQALIYKGHERVRRCQEIVEIAGIDSATGNMRVNTVFTYDPVNDTFLYSGRSVVYTRIMERRGWSREEMSTEIENRRRLLLAMKEQGISDYVTFSQIIQVYSVDPEGVLAREYDLRSVPG